MSAQDDYPWDSVTFDTYARMCDELDCLRSGYLARLAWEQGNEIGRLRAQVVQLEADLEEADAKDEAERLRAWVLCPDHGPWCGGVECCCADQHQPELARTARPPNRRFELVDIAVPGCRGCDQPCDYRIRDTVTGESKGSYCYMCAQRALYRLNGDES